MTHPKSIHSVLERQLLVQFGDRLKFRRTEQSITGVVMADRLGVSRMTLRAMEAGDPAVSFGTYVRYMSELGLVSDIAILAGDAIVPAPKGSAAHQSLAERSTVKIEVSAPRHSHKIQDTQSLVLHEAAIAHIQQYPSLLNKAIESVDQQIEASKSLANRSLPLLKKWRQVLEDKNWRTVLASTQTAAQLRQASPLTVLLPEDTRKKLLADVRALKDGVKFVTKEPV